MKPGLNFNVRKRLILFIIIKTIIILQITTVLGLMIIMLSRNEINKKQK